MGVWVWVWRVIERGEGRGGKGRGVEGRGGVDEWIFAWCARLVFQWVFERGSRLRHGNACTSATVSPLVLSQSVPCAPCRVHCSVAA